MNGEAKENSTTQNQRENDGNSQLKNRESPPGRTMGLTKVKRGIIFGISWLAIVLGILVGNFWSQIYDAIINHELVLSPTSRSFSMWKETPIPMYLEIYLFNWTNADEVTKHHVKPHFDEIGPYVFKEVDYKVNKVWNDNGTVTFQQRRIWHFLEERSNGSLNDQITNVNAIAATLAYKVRHKKLIARIAVNAALNILKETLTITKTARELLFDGYDDELLVVAHKLNMSDITPYTKFGWFYGRNNSDSYDGTFNMLTGSTDRQLIGMLQEWNYSNKSKIYPGQCSSISGSLGDLWPSLTKNDTVPVFAPDICTLLHLQYDKMIEFEGLMGKRFVSTATMLDNGTNVPSRACYCEGGECQPSGVLNVSSCKFGAPAFISLPHFYLADDSYNDAIEGLKPDKDKHEFFVVVQPDVGIPMQINARLQLNLRIEPVKNIKMYDNVPKVYVPILWFRQEANLTSSYAGQIKFLFILPLLGHVTFYGIAGLGFLLFFIGIGILVRERRRADDAQRLIKNETNGVVQNERSE